MAYNPFALEHWLNLSLVRGLGSAFFLRLLKAYDSPGAVLRTPVEQLSRHIPAAVAHTIHQNDRQPSINQALRWCKQPHCHIVTLADESYPKKLLEITDPPPLLYLRGNLSLLSGRLIAIVGSRSASAAGTRNTVWFAKALSEAGIGVVSGLAQGIDAAAHQGAMEGKGSTIAVFGTGIDIVYPKANRLLASRISEAGLLMSEFPLGTRPMQSHFPRRNRLISGLSTACLIIEATLKSGSLITARTALEQGRDVFAVPGSINSPLHQGCHQLIKQGAVLTENIHDILNELGWQAQALPLVSAVKTDNTDTLLDCIDYEPTSLDDIAARSHISADELLTKLLSLEMSGHIASTPGGHYQRL